MPDAGIMFPQLETKQPAELLLRREELLTQLKTKYKGYDDPDVPAELLHELMEVTRALRRKTAGPPKAKKEPGAKPGKIDAADLMDNI